MSSVACQDAQKPVLEARNLVCERDDRVLFRDLDLTLHPGHALRFAGRNGSGKTTLMRGLVGLNIHLEGDIHWCDAETTPWLYIGHRPGISAHLTVLENLRFLARLRGLVPRAADFDRALAAVQLQHFDDSPGQQLSAGQQRRVLLALLYLPQLPLCWVLDEPFTALDREGVETLEAHLGAHCAAGGSLLFSTHHEPRGFAHDTLSLDATAAERTA